MQTKSENEMNLIQSTSQTMSSREIAELTGKEHKHVRRDIMSMLDDLKISDEGLVHLWTDPQNKQEYEEYWLDRRLTDCLLTGYSAKARMKVIDRWHALELKQAPALPKTFAEALQLAADQAKKIEEAKPKVEYHDKVLASDNGITTTEVASELGMSAIKLNRLLASLKVQRSVGGRWVLTASHLNQGLTVEVTHIDDGGKSRHAMKWTEKGRKLIHELAGDLLNGTDN